MGLLLFTMLCGHHPFERSTEIATLAAILDADFAFPPGAAPSAPAKDLIRRLLVPQPERRATAAEGLRVLAVALAPVMPKATAVLWESLGAAEAIGPLADQRIADAATWGQLPTGTAITKPASLFPRIEMDSVEAPDA